MEVWTSVLKKGIKENTTSSTGKRNSQVSYGPPESPVGENIIII